MDNEQEMRSAFEAVLNRFEPIVKTYIRLAEDKNRDGKERLMCAGAGAGVDMVLDAIRAIVGELNSPAPEWSLEVPTESGFYWCRWPDDGPNEWQEPQVEELDVQDGITILCSVGTEIDQRLPFLSWWPIPIAPPTGGRP